MVITSVWALPVRELLAEQLRRFRGSLDLLARNLRDRVASGVGEALTTLVRALLGPGEVRHRPYEPPRPSWQRSTWDDESSDHVDWDDDSQPWSSPLQRSSPPEVAAASPSHRFGWLAPLTNLWSYLSSSRFRPLVLSAVATGIVAQVAPAWVLPLFALVSSALGLIAIADRAADEASRLAGFVEP